MRADAQLGTRLQGAPPSYWLDLRGYDPVRVAASQRQPLLVLQGERDYQVTLDGDFARWQTLPAVRPGVTCRSYRGLNHFFLTGQGPSLPGEYEEAGWRIRPGRDPSIPIASAVSSVLRAAMVGWGILALSRRRERLHEPSPDRYCRDSACRCCLRVDSATEEIGLR